MRNSRRGNQHRRSARRHACQILLRSNYRPPNGPVIRPLNTALLIGIISGTYSSIFNATCLLVVWENGDLGNLWRRLTGRRRPAPAAAAA